MGRCVESGERVGLWASQRLGAVWDARSCVALGLVDGDEITAGVIYENYNGVSIMAHIVAERPLSRYFLWAIFDYPFRVCGVEKIVCPIESTNARSLRLAGHMGFTEEARLKGCAPGGDIVLYSLAKPDCRFLRGRYEQKAAPSARAA